MLTTAVLLATLSLAAEQRPAVMPGKDLMARLRRLEKQIEAVRGLKFKLPVAAAVIRRPKGADRGVQGYYSTRDKKLFLYDDIKGAYRLGVLIHEMVHALQDQHFRLDRLHPESFGSDADLAKAALIEGDATYTMIEVLKKEQPRVAAMLQAPLEGAKNLQNAFLYAQGARYVKALKDRGGWAAVNMRYRFPPRATATILHPEGTATIDLGPGKTHGEFGLIRLLAAHPKTAPQAVQAAAGWKADLAVEDGQLKSWVIAFGTPAQARRFQAALARLRQDQSPELKPVAGEANVWTGPKGNVVAVLARGERVLALEAPDRTAYRTLLDRHDGPLSLTVYARQDKKQISFGELVERLLRADLICVGETHDSEPHHRVQLQLIKALFAHDERLGVGLEMFQRPFQGPLDRYQRGEAGEAELLKATEYQKRWGFDWALYRPIAEFCRKNGVPLAALNAPRELTARVSKVGHAGLTDKEKKDLGRIDFHHKEHRAYWYERLAKMHGDGKAPAAQKERSYQVMTVWDDYMAASAARFQQDRGLRRLIVLAGSGHVERGFGIPQRAARRTGGRVLTIGVQVGGDPGKLGPDATTDFVIVVR